MSERKGRGLAHPSEDTGKLPDDLTVRRWKVRALRVVFEGYISLPWSEAMALQDSLDQNTTVFLANGPPTEGDYNSTKELMEALDDTDRHH
jgi:hypothetical protein